MSHPPDPGSPADQVLVAEREHLRQSRTALARMRDRTAALDASAGGDWVSREYLSSALAERLRALADDPAVPLFFGRIDYGTERHSGESFHIGRRHVAGADAEPMVVDWRAPISLPFYRATPAAPLGVRARRRFGFSDGVLTGYEDEDLTRPAGGHSAILDAEIERPRVGPMRDIVATIQPEQDVIVRTGLAGSVCVQGAPGTGKTAVGLHRAAYLLYTHRDQLTRQGMLVVGPNASFLRYIREVLPALGEIDARHTTIAAIATETVRSLRAGQSVRGTDVAEVARLKGDAKMAEVIHRAVWSHLAVPEQGLMVPRGARRFRVSLEDVERLVADLHTRGVRYGAAQAMLPQALAHRVLVAMERSGESPDDRVQDAVARSRAVKQYAAALWPTVNPAKVVFRLFSDAEFLAAMSAGVLSEDEQRLLLWARPAASPARVHWSLADAICLDEAADVVTRTPSVGHLVVDEAQDLSAMMLRALGRRCATGSVTVLGDLAQATTPWGQPSWQAALAQLGKPDAHREELTRGFRVPAEVLDYAARLLPVIAPGLAPPTSVRRSRGHLTFHTYDREPPVAALVATALTEQGSVGLIVPEALVPSVTAALQGIPHAVLGSPGADDDPAEFDSRLDVVPAGLAKGLEFDHVVLLEPAAIVTGEPDRLTGLRRLYVCLTRAVTSLVIAHRQPLPGELGEG